MDGGNGRRRPAAAASTKIALALAVLAGMLAGVGAYTFFYARGASYMSDDPLACVNCHVMREHFDGWKKASHRAAATCNDCHVPRGFPAKWWGKALNGYHHSRAFTLGDFPEPIRIKPGNAAVLASNCLHCHGDQVREITGSRPATGNPPDCVRCHADIGHGPSR